MRYECVYLLIQFIGANVKQDNEDNDILIDCPISVNDKLSLRLHSNNKNSIKAMKI